MARMTIDYQALREAAEQATQDEWVAYILPGHNGIYPARTSEGRHCADTLLTGLASVRGGRAST
ncbi:ead/Ea22-like family protein [Escherichia coli]|uniref:ead/Ea22-like family protein n=2 Tax=Escherichia coli TaxID=562 RepID=UPI0027D20D37|nr:ead/Ea22-like family protein [Escherichia coli]